MLTVGDLPAAERFWWFYLLFSQHGQSCPPLSEALHSHRKQLQGFHWKYSVVHHLQNQCIKRCVGTYLHFRSKNHSSLSERKKWLPKWLTVKEFATWFVTANAHMSMVYTVCRTWWGIYIYIYSEPLHRGSGKTFVSWSSTANVWVVPHQWHICQQSTMY